MKKMFSKNKKIFFTLFSIFAVVGYGVFVFAAAPPGGYTPGTTLNPDCAPGDTDCIVAVSGGGSVGIGTTVSNNPDLNGILYTDATSRIVTDTLFVRNNSTKDTFIGKDVQSSYSQDIITLGPTIVTVEPTGTFQPGETVVGQTSGAVAVLSEAHALPDPPQWLLSLTSATGTFQQGENIVGQTSGAIAPVGLFSDLGFTNGSSFAVFDLNNSLDQVATGTISAVLGGGQYSVVSSGTIIQGGLIMDSGNNPTVINNVISTSSNQINTTAQASLQLGELLAGFFPGTTQGAGSFYTDISSDILTGQWVGQDFSGNNHTFNQVAFDNANVRGVYTNGVLGNPGASPFWQTGVVDAGSNWSGALSIEESALSIEQTNRINLNANSIAIGQNNSSTEYFLPTTRGTAGQVLTIDGSGYVTWQTPSGGGGGSGTPGGSSGSLQFNNGGLFDGTNGAYWDLGNSRLGIGTTTPSARLAIRSEVPGTAYNTNFSGAGLNDGSFSGTYTGTGSDTFTVYIDSTNSPNTFSWSSGNGSGSNIQITGAPQYLADGISITFASTDGHSIGNQWQYIISAGSSFSGSGLDDVTFGGVYSGLSGDAFTIQVQANNQELTFSSLTGTFQVGEVVTGIGSGAAGVVFDVTANTVVLKQVVGIFNPGSEQIVGSTSGANADLDSVNSFDDMFSWSSNISGSGQDIIIDGTAQVLGNGITIQFGSTTGHTNYDQWSYFYGTGNSFAGNGLNDASFTGSYTGMYTNDTFTVTIDSTSIGGDTFSWSSNDASGSNVAITGTTQLLYDGIYVSFNSVNGHTVGNEWQYTIAPGGATTTFAVTSSTDTNFFTINSEGAVVFSNPAINIGGIGYVFPNAQAAGAGYVLTNDGSGNLTWEAGSGSSPMTLSGTGTLYSSGYGTTGDTGDFNIFLGESAGSSAAGAGYSNFIGFNAGSGAANVQYSNFIGYQSGFNATDARDSNFFGVYSGQGATFAEYSNFMGRGSGTNSTNANNSNFFGYTAGAEAINASYANFFGVGAGYGATNANDSNFFGTNAGQSAISANNSNFFGLDAGYQASSASNSNFFGLSAGYTASGAEYSNFFGNSAGYGATGAYASNFLGNESGYGATGAYTSNFIGNTAGKDATNATSSNFFGSAAGIGAAAANNSNFFGQNAGNLAVNAANSNFFGNQSGYQATNAANSSFFGLEAGNGATDASNSNFFGQFAGKNATFANNSNFFGVGAGIDATGAEKSNFFGLYAGQGATNAYHSNFMGNGAGSGATSARYSNFFGIGAGLDATDAYNSNFLGESAGYAATGAYGSNFMGYQAGKDATGAFNSNFFGQNAGNGAIDATFSNFTGSNAGVNATNASSSNFFGPNAGYSATYATNSNFFGGNSGYAATNSDNSNFFGYTAGQSASDADHSNFFGYASGYLATNAANSNFIGRAAGYQATNAANSIFIGYQSGNQDSVDNTVNAGDYSILIGPNTSTGGFENSIAIGGSATNNASNQFMIGSSNGPIDEIVMVSTGGTTCATDINGTACSSDERLKTNIIDLTTGTLDKVLNTKTVTFNWNNNTDTINHIGFIAQDIQQYFPELVSTGSTGYLSVNYAGMTPVLVQAIREMNLKITTINDMNTPNSWRDAIVAWFGNVENGITKLFVKEIETKTLCVADDTGDKTCITKSQLDQLLNGSVNGSIAPAPSPSPDPSPTPDPDQNPTPDTNPGTDSIDPGTSDVPSDTPTDPGTPPADSPAPASEPAPATPTE